MYRFEECDWKKALAALSKARRKRAARFNIVRYLSEHALKSLVGHLLGDQPYRAGDRNARLQYDRKLAAHKRECLVVQPFASDVRSKEIADHALLAHSVKLEDYRIVLFEPRRCVHLVVAFNDARDLLSFF